MIKTEKKQEWETFFPEQQTKFYQKQPVFLMKMT